MNPLWQKLKEIVLQLLARATSGPAFMANGIRTATLSCASVLAQMLQMGIADDLRKLKDDGLRKSKANADLAEVKVRELAARVVEAENQANLIKRNDRISKAEAIKKLAEAAKTNAEAKAILLNAESEQIKTRAAAMAALLEAVGNLKAKGGGLAVNPQNLARLLGVSDLEVIDESHSSPNQSNAGAAD